MDMVGEVEHGGSFGKLQQVAFGGEHIHLVFVEVHLELVHHLKVVACLQGSTYVGKPFVHTAFGLHPFIAPVGSQTAFGNLVHALRTNLHLYPFALRSQYGDVQAFVSVRFRHTEPVAQSFGVGLVHIGDDGIGLPAQGVFLAPCSYVLMVLLALNDNSDGKQVVDAFKAAFLFLHLLPDGVNALGAPFHVESQSCCL